MGLARRTATQTNERDANRDDIDGAVVARRNDSRPAGRVILDDVNVIRSSTWFSFCFFRIKINE